MVAGRTAMLVGTAEAKNAGGEDGDAGGDKFCVRRWRAWSPPPPVEERTGVRLVEERTAVLVEETHRGEGGGRVGQTPGISSSATPHDAVVVGGGGGGNNSSSQGLFDAEFFLFDSSSQGLFDSENVSRRNSIIFL